MFSQNLKTASSWLSYLISWAIQLEDVSRTFILQWVASKEQLKPTSILSSPLHFSLWKTSIFDVLLKEKKVKKTILVSYLNLSYQQSVSWSSRMVVPGRCVWKKRISIIMSLETRLLAFCLLIYRIVLSWCYLVQYENSLTTLSWILYDSNSLEKFIDPNLGSDLLSTNCDILCTK